MKELNIRLQCMIADEIRDKGGARHSRQLKVTEKVLLGGSIKATGL